MIDHGRPSARSSVFAAWTLIWFGTILSINPQGALSQLGAGLWVAGVGVQLLVVARWGRPSSGAPVARRKPPRVPARV